ncbi:DUF4157 domain-containing protein [Microcystis sp. LEGE 08355]|uniref:eCIS core domain-containing protein n=1 Tax=Microcystis sp. LEGE 08355 TaxID=1828687 RepID=UPI0018817C96|nr:DUF4157 domain-containing protein [Microcystis sp. LEGE 08355]MBE9072209.1 DUF4157 domain-containing protein [Microcystis sp. LEGE 08355]
MRDRQSTPDTKSQHSQPTKEREAQRATAQEEVLATQQDPLTQVISRIGSAPSAKVHADLLSRATSDYPARGRQLMLQMQRQYGNRYVQRVMELSRQGEGEAEATPEVEAAIEQARGGGRSLDSGIQRQMESAFGTNFSGVRVHTDSTADALNQSLSARAFTTGQDIFFRQGEYNPGSSSGKELLAHELTHVVQQTGTVRGKLVIGQPDDAYEREADQVAKAVMQMEQLATATGEGLAQRQMEEEEEPLQCPAGELAKQQMGEEEESKQALASSSLISRKAGSEQEEGLDETKEGCGCTNCDAEKQERGTVTLQMVPILAGITPESGVLKHLQASEASAEKNSSIYRNAILQFQRANSQGKVAIQQQKLLESESTAVRQQDSSKTIRRCIPGCTPSRGTATRRGQVKSGPTYTPSGTIAATKNSDGSKSARFDMSAEFEHDPSNGIYASCCEIRQYIKWTSDADRPRNPGFMPASSYSANTWYEDRDSVGKRYGHRSGVHAECISINHYEDSLGSYDCPNGSKFVGQDTPRDGSGAKTGKWDFELKVIDTCNGDRQIGSTASVTVDWK